MASKAEWKDALQRIAGYGFGLNYLKHEVGRLSSIEDKTPRELESEIMARVKDLEKYKAEVQIVNAQRIAAEGKAREARIEARDKGFEIEDLEYQNRVLKALLWLEAGRSQDTFALSVTTTREDMDRALALTKDHEAEFYHDPSEFGTGNSKVVFLPKSEYRSPMEGIGWHTFESKED